jgi:hypothetical protein
VSAILKGLGVMLPVMGLLAGCGERPGSEGAKVFLALGVCLAAVFLIFYIVVKSREKD